MGLKKIRKISTSKISSENSTYEQLNSDTADKTNVLTKLEDAKAFLTKNFKNSSDVVYYEFEAQSGIRALIVYISGLVNKEILNRDVVTPFITNAKEEDIKKSIFVSYISETQKMSDIINQILDGNTAMFVEGLDKYFIIESKGWEKRAIEQPDAELVIRGPREGFVESIIVNMSLLRRKIKNNNLVFESMNLGKQTKTNIAIAYIDGIANKEVLKEVRGRLNSIDTDSILESGYIEQYIEDSPLSLFTTVGNSQKPDVIAAKILEGRSAIFCDGTPHVLTVPHLFVENIQTGEDYYIRPFIATLLRGIRVLALLISVLLPSLYVALQTFNQEMIPTALLITMSGAREGIPFPALAEAFLMIVIFELLRESGTRLPRAIGSAVSIVGALVIGDAAVNAGIVSSPMVMVVAITAVASFIVPSLTEIMTIYRFILLLLGGVMGIYGIACGVFIMVVQTVSLRSFGIPYTSPMAPFDAESMKDYIIRFPLWSMKRRPQSIVKGNEKRRGSIRRK